MDQEKDIKEPVEDIQKNYSSATRAYIARTAIQIACVIAGFLCIGQFLEWKNGMLQKASAGGNLVDLNKLEQAIHRQNELDRQIQLISSVDEILKQIRQESNPFTCSEIIRQIQHRIPESVWMSHLEMQGNRSITIYGQSMSHAAIRQFTGRLRQCPMIESVKIKDDRSVDKTTQMIEYTIFCVISDSKQEGVL